MRPSSGVPSADPTGNERARRRRRRRRAQRARLRGVSRPRGPARPRPRAGGRDRWGHGDRGGHAARLPARPLRERAHDLPVEPDRPERRAAPRRVRAALPLSRPGRRDAVRRRPKHHDVPRPGGDRGRARALLAARRARVRGAARGLGRDQGLAERGAVLAADHGERRDRRARGDDQGRGSGPLALRERARHRARAIRGRVRADLLPLAFAHDHVARGPAWHRAAGALDRRGAAGVQLDDRGRGLGRPAGSARADRAPARRRGVDGRRGDARPRGGRSCRRRGDRRRELAPGPARRHLVGDRPEPRAGGEAHAQGRGLPPVRAPRRRPRALGRRQGGCLRRPVRGVPAPRDRADAKERARPARRESARPRAPQSAQLPRLVPWRRPGPRAGGRAATAAGLGGLPPPGPGPLPDRCDDTPRRVGHRRARTELRAGGPGGPRARPRRRDRATRGGARVKLSYFTLTDNPVTFGAKRQDSNQLLLDTVDQAIAAEAMGYHGAWLPEHHFGGVGVCPTPNQGLAFVAAKTTRLRLPQAIVLLPVHQPLRAAEESAVLDLLSGGRASWAVGRGYDEREYRAFEIPFSESLERFEEEMDLVVKAWTEESFTWRGRHHTIPDPVTVLPRVVQRPHPPIYVASFSEHSMRLAAARGYNILFAPFAASMVFGTLADAVAKFKELARAAGHPNVKAACSYFTAIADSEAEVRAAKERLAFYLKGISPAFPHDMSKAPPSLQYFKEIVDRIHAMTPDQVGERSIVTGGRDDVVAQLKRVEAAGIDEVIMYFSFGAYPHGNVLAMMERVAKEDLPDFREALAAAR